MPTRTKAKPPVFKPVLAANVRRLLDSRGGSGAYSGRLMKLGLVNGNAQRLYDDTTDNGIELIAKMAAAAGFAPWQLLVPGFDPLHPPQLALEATVPVHARWPFQNIDAEAIAALVDAAAATGLRLSVNSERSSGSFDIEMPAEYVDARQHGARQ